MKKKRTDPLPRIGYYFELLRVRLMRLEDYAIRRPYPDRDLSKKIILVEITYVQIRKIIELIMFMSVSAHEISEISLSQKIKDGWNADKLMGWLSRVSSQSFPDPIDVEPTYEEGIEGRFVDARNRRDCLDSGTAKRYYFACGDILHEQVEPVTHEDLDAYIERAKRFFELTKNLFETFSFEPKSAKKIVLGHLNYGEPKPPVVFYAETQSGTGNNTGQ